MERPKRLAQSPKPVQKVMMGMEHIFKSLSFRDLEILDKAARLESVSGAARELRLLPPQVSKSIKKIERAAGVSLFNRSRTGVRLTAEGRKFLEIIREFQVFVAQANWSQKGDHEGKSRLFTLAGASFLMCYLAAPAVAELSTAFPSCRFRLAEMDESSLMEAALKDHVELIIHFGKLKLFKNWHQVLLGELTWILCGRNNHPLGNMTTERETLEFPFIFPVYLAGAGPRFGDDKCPIPIQKRVRGEETQTAETGLRIAQASNQLIFLPALVAKDRIRQGQLREIKVNNWPVVREKLYISVNEERFPKRVFEELRKIWEGSVV